MQMSNGEHQPVRFEDRLARWLHPTLTAALVGACLYIGNGLTQSVNKNTEANIQINSSLKLIRQDLDYIRRDVDYNRSQLEALRDKDAK